MKLTSLDLCWAVLDGLYDGVCVTDGSAVIIYWNKGAERITGFTEEDVIGVGCSDNVFLRMNSGGDPNYISAYCPMDASRQNSKELQEELFIPHKNGHRFPVLSRSFPALGENGEILGSVRIFTDRRDIYECREKIADLEKMSMLDSLTNLGNRRHMEMHLQRNLDGMRRYGWSFGVFFIDIDDFKQINDTHGHQVGDDILKMVANTVLGSLRLSDVVGRWGGDEFVAAVQHVNNELLQVIGTKIRNLIRYSGLFIQDKGKLRVTASIGATMAKPGDEIGDIMKRSDRLMYQSKKRGKNTLTVGSS